MKIGSLQKTSFIDYPAQIAAVIFTQGCNFRCPYCHNPELVLPERFSPPRENGLVMDFLEKRRGKLDAVVITGGEPCLQAGLVDFVCAVKELGYLVKLDTNGTLPQVLQTLLDRKLLDYVAMDIKAPFEKYPAVAGAAVAVEDVAASVALIINTAPDYEFRTTAAPSILGMDDFRAMAGIVRGARRYALQEFVPSKHVSINFDPQGSYSSEDLEKIRKTLQQTVGEVIIR